MKQNTRFRHESLQDKETIVPLLEALTEGIKKGKVVLEDDEGGLVLHPIGLMSLKISGAKGEDRNKISLRISWQGDHQIKKGKPIKLKGG